MECMLSVGQQALWFLYRMAPTSAAYNVAWSMRVRGQLDIRDLTRAVELAVGRHEMLRSVFTELDSGPRRILGDAGLLRLDVRDAQGIDEPRLLALVRDEIERPFQLETGGPARLVLLRIAPDDAALVFVAHHIAMDFSSVALVVRDVLDAYRALRGGGKPDWAPQTGCYADFVAAERQLLDSPRGEEMAARWRSVLSGAPTSIELPLDHPRPREQRFQGAVHTFQLPPDVLDGLVPAARAGRVTPVRHLIGVFQALLYRYTSQADFLLGCDASSSLASAHRGVAGYFSNRLVLRARCTRATTFRELVREVNDQLTRGLSDVDFPFAMVHRALGLPTGTGSTSLTQVAVSMISVGSSDPLLALATRSHGHEVDYAGLRLMSLDMPQQAGQFDLTFEVIRSRSSVHCAMKYDTDLFEPATVRRMATHFVRLMRAAATDPDQRVAEVSLVEATEQARLLAFATGRPCPAKGES